MTDILSAGRSSRLYNSLVKDKKLFTEIHCYGSGSFDKGTITAEGKLVKGVTIKEAEAALDIELKKIMTSPVSENELTRVKNKVESTMVFSEIDLSGRALNLAIAEYMGDAGLINTEVERYRSVTASEITERANEIFRESNCSTLYYLSKK